MLRLNPPRRWPAVLLGLGLALALFAWRSRPAPPRYAIVDLGVLPGVSMSEAYGLNNRGDVTGLSGDPSGLLYAAHAFLYQNGKMTDLSALEPPGNVMAHAINDRGEITGTSWPYHGTGSHAFLYSGGKMQDLTPPPGYRTSTGDGLNNQGDVCGRTYVRQGGPPSRAFFYSHGKAISLPLPAGCADGTAEGINDQGQIVGRGSGSAPGAFLYDRRSRTLARLPVPPPFTSSEATKINNQGQIVGVAYFAAGAAGSQTESEHAVLWQNGAMTDLGTLPHATGSLGLGLNNRGEAVGYCLQQYGTVEAAWRRLVWRTDDNRLWAFVWRNGRMADLNELIPANSGWNLEVARGINDRGQIVGQGLHGGQERAFLLTPTP